MKLLAGGIVVAAFAILSPLAWGQTNYYTGNASGSFQVGTDWSLGVPPDGETAFILTGATFKPNATTFTPGPTAFTISQNDTTDTLNQLQVFGQEAAPSGTGGAGDGTVTIVQGTGDTIKITGNTPSLTNSDFIVANGATLNVNGGSITQTNGVISVGDADQGFSIGYPNPNTIPDTGTGTLNLNSVTLNYDQMTDHSFFNGNGDDQTMQVGVDGSVGKVTENGTSVVITGADLRIGNGGSGTFTLNDTSTLDIGTPPSQSASAPKLEIYMVYIGATQTDTGGADASGNGTLNLNGSSVFNIGPNADVQVGTAAPPVGSPAFTAPTAANGSSGTINQNDSSVVNISDPTATGSNPTLELGAYTGGRGTYNLNSGTINLSDGGTIVVGSEDGGTGIFNEGTKKTSGSIIGAAGDTSVVLDIGNNPNGDNAGTGTFNLNAGVVSLDGTFAVGGGAGTDGSGTFNQYNGQVTLGTGSTATIGGNTGTTTGVYNSYGGTATFENGLRVNATGTVNEDGGNVNVSGAALSFGTGAVYNLNGGTLSVGNGFGGSTNATLNFGGGTLTNSSTTAATLTDAFTNTGTVTGEGGLNAQGGNIVITQHLKGAGGFMIEGSLHTVTLTAPTAANAPNFIYSGPTIINGGNLHINNNIDPVDVFPSSISGTTGTLTINAPGANTLQLTGTTDFTGSTTLGTSGNSKVQVFNSGTLGSISGAGQLETSETTGPSVFNLVGTNTYTGTTTIDANTTLLANSLDSNSVVAPGTIGSNSPVQAPIAPFVIGGLVGGTATGSLTQSATSGMLIRVQGTSAFDSFSVGAPSTADGTVTVTGYSALGGTSYAIINSNAANITEEGQTSNSTALLRTSVTTTQYYTNGTPNTLPPPSTVGPTTTPHVYLNVDQLPISTYAYTPNEISIANSLDSGLVNPQPGLAIYTALDSLTAAQVPQALDALIPVNYLYMRDIAFENSTFLANKLDNSLANLRSGYSGLDTSGLSMVNPGMGSSLGRSLNSMLAFNNEGPAPNGVDYYPSDGTSPVSPAMEPTLPGVPEGTPTAPGSISDTPVTGMTPTASPPPPSTIFDGVGQGFNEFISGDVILADLNENASNSPTPKATYTAADATGGVSFRVTSNLAVGALFDYNHTDASVDSVNSHIRVDTYSPGVFATFFEKGFYANGLFAFGYNNYSNDRNIDFGGVGTTAISRPSGEQYVFNLDGGYDFHPDPHWVLGPTIGAEYTHLDVDGFDESGAGTFDENIGAQSADSLRGRIGGHVIYQIQAGNFLFQPNFTLAFQREFLDDSFGLTGTPNIPGASAFTISGTNPGRNSALIGAGVTATIDNQFNFFLNYLAEVGGDDYFVQSAEGGFKATF